MFKVESNGLESANLQAGKSKEFLNAMNLIKKSGLAYGQRRSFQMDGIHLTRITPMGWNRCLHWEVVTIAPNFQKYLKIFFTTDSESTINENYF
jgi:hypothetical protein